MPMQQAVTTRDIAEQLSLSVSTVGRALANDSRISAQTRFRVEQKAAELGYIGNQAARMMRGAPSTVVGLVVPDIRNSFYSTAAHALTQSMGEQGYQVMLSETGDDRNSELAKVKGMVAARVAGVIHVPTPNPHPDTVRLLRQVPHVQLLRKHASLGDHWFGIDDREVLRTATEHLRRLGHTRIAYFGGAPNLSTSRDRLEGYLEAMGEAHVPDLVIHMPPDSQEAASTAIAELLKRSDPPSAVVTATVRATQGVLLELAAHRISVPGALSVVGFGDEPGFSWWGPGLTTMGLPVHEVATACAMWLLGRLGGNEPDSPYISRVGGFLVERGSTSARKGQS